MVHCSARELVGKSFSLWQELNKDNSLDKLLVVIWKLCLSHVSTICSLMLTYCFELRGYFNEVS